MNEYPTTLRADAPSARPFLFRVHQFRCRWTSFSSSKTSKPEPALRKQMRSERRRWVEFRQRGLERVLQRDIAHTSGLAKWG